MKDWLKRHHVRYGLLSIACPIVTLAIVIGYQSIAHAHFWNSVLANTEDDANRNAGAMMAISEGLIQIFSTSIACVMGILLAMISIKKQKKLLGVGLLALLINGLPLALLLFLLVRKGR